MIASTILAAALASTNPSQAATAPAAAHNHAAMAGHDMSGHKDMAAAKGMAEGKMDCCKDGCACCAKKDAKVGEAKPAS